MMKIISIEKFLINEKNKFDYFKNKFKIVFVVFKKGRINGDDEQITENIVIYLKQIHNLRSYVSRKEVFFGLLKPTEYPQENLNFLYRINLTTFSIIMILSSNRFFFLHVSNCFVCQFVSMSLLNIFFALQFIKLHRKIAMSKESSGNLLSWVASR